MTTPTSATSRTLTTPWRRVRSDFKRLTQLLCPLASVFLILLGVHPAIALVPTLYPLLVFLRRSLQRLARHSSRNSLNGEHAARVLIGLIPVVIYATAKDTNVLGWTAALLTSLLAPYEPALAKALRGRRLRCTNLPGVSLRNAPLVPINLVTTVNLVVAPIVAAALALELDTRLVVILPILGIILTCVATAAAFHRVIQSVETDNNLYNAILAYEPKFILYYGVGTGSEYQVRMWIKYLERIEEPFIVVLRHTSTFPKIAAMTDAPVVVRTSMRQLDDVVVPSVTTAFYVNNGALNAHLVRYPRITHVQLLHGDSDKATSFNPITGMFDKIFVAGQAAIDRYVNNGIDIPLHKFTIVGRPQVEGVAPRNANNIPVTTVLYAPTWQGHFADTNYSSVSVAPELIRELVQRGQRVIFRPHPYSYRDAESRSNIAEIHSILENDQRQSQRGHIWGRQAESEMSVFDCFNAADAMISDVSSVVPDFLYSGKPFALVSMNSSTEDFQQEFPLAAAAYTIERDLANLGSVLDELLLHDRLEGARQRARVHYLGDFEPSQYANAFVDAAREIVLASEHQSALPRSGRVDNEELSAGELGIQSSLMESTAVPASSASATDSDWRKE